jgi:hypothetical protein
VVIDRHANDNPRKPDANRTVAPEALDAAKTPQQGFLDDILSIHGISCRRHCDLDEKRAALAGRRLKIDIDYLFS